MAQEVEATVNKGAFTFFGVDKSRSERDPYGLRYADFVVPLVKAVQELTSKMDEQQKTLDKQASTIDSLISIVDKSDVKSTPDPSTGRTSLFQNNPNPFTIDTEIKMELSDEARKADLIVYNMEGTQLKSIPVSNRGNSSVKISAGELKPGLYLYSLIVDGKVVDIKRMIITN